MDYIERLKAEHGDLDDLFHEISLAKDAATRAEILGEIGRLLLAHVALEETLICQAAAFAPRENGLWEDFETRLRVERIVGALDAIDPAHTSFAAKVTSLQELVEERIEYEENQLFPKLDRHSAEWPTPGRALSSRRPTEPDLIVGGVQ
jgi:hemerythrin superfamily protein